YENKTANAYDLTGSLPLVNGPNFALAIISVVLTPVDDVTSFQSQVVPQFWIPNMSMPYEDTGTSTFQIRAGINPSMDGISVEYYYVIISRAATVMQSSFFKYSAYATVPVNVSVTRVA
ncbi:hypothetical protein, partial [Curtobacterium sp. MMLR14_002]|uniref:hypothetical protein n=1 Tax=Curtobacterium sp. MMLR14_002 TaxID=1898741 RepID=UPI00149559EB